MNKTSKDIVVGIIVTVIGGIILYFVLDIGIKPNIESGGDIKDTTINSNQPPPDTTVKTVPSTKPKEQDSKDNIIQRPAPSTSQKEEKKIVKVTLIVDAEFSDASIYANGVQISPVDNTLTIKELEIEYETNPIKLVVKTNQRICEKLITVPSDYKYKSSNKITITCVQ